MTAEAHPAGGTAAGAWPAGAELEDGPLGRVKTEKDAEARVRDRLGTTAARGRGCRRAGGGGRMRTLCAWESDAGAWSRGHRRQGAARGAWCRESVCRRGVGSALCRLWGRRCAVADAAKFDKFEML